MKHAAILFVVLLVSIISISSVEAGNVLQDFTFETIDGKTIDFNELKGTPMVINIGATWWHLCAKGAPELEKAHLSYKDKGVFFLEVFTMSKDNEIKEFVENYHITFPVGKENGIANKLGVKGIQTTVFIASDGSVMKRSMNIVDYKGFVEGIEAILQ